MCCRRQRETCPWSRQWCFLNQKCEGGNWKMWDNLRTDPLNGGGEGEGNNWIGVGECGGLKIPLFRVWWQGGPGNKWNLAHGNGIIAVILGMSLHMGNTWRRWTLLILMGSKEHTLQSTLNTLEEISTQNGPFNFYSNSMSSCVSQWNCFKFEIPYRY